MNLDLQPGLEDRLREAARRLALSPAELIERIVTSYLDATSDSPAGWVGITRERLMHVWPEQDFSDWQRPWLAGRDVVELR